MMLLYLLKAMIPADEIWHLAGEKGEIEINLKKTFKISILICITLGLTLFTLKYGLNPPKKLKNWATYSFYNKAHTPWLSKEQRKILHNATDICIYGGNLIRVLKTMKNPFEKALYSAIFTPINKYYKFRWEKKYFKFTPLLKLIRLARRIKIDKTLSISTE